MADPFLIEEYNYRRIHLKLLLQFGFLHLNIKIKHEHKSRLPKLE